MAKRSGAGGERACAAREAWQWGASGRASRASRSRRCAAVVLERDMVSQEDRGRRSLGRLASVKWRVLFGSPRAPVLYARGADNADGEWIDSSTRHHEQCDSDLLPFSFKSCEEKLRWKNWEELAFNFQKISKNRPQ